MPRFKVGVKGVTFDAASFTMVSEDRCRNLHGHTYTVEVEVEGEPDPNTGAVIDFLKLRRLLKEVVDELDHAVLLPRRFEGQAKISGPFSVNIKYVEKPHVTAEMLALEIAERLSKSLGPSLRVSVTVYEGRNKYARVEYP